MSNQASEDELATNIDKIIEYWDFSPLQDEDSRIERVHKEIESLIRTEKLQARVTEIEHVANYTNGMTNQMFENLKFRIAELKQELEKL